MCVKVSGEGKWCGKEEGRAGQVLTDPMVSVPQSEPEQYLQACADLEAREDGSSSPGRREGLELACQGFIAWPAMHQHPRTRRQRWELGCDLTARALLFCWNFRRKAPKLRKKGISSLFIIYYSFTGYLALFFLSELGMTWKQVPDKQLLVMGWWGWG